MQKNISLTFFPHHTFHIPVMGIGFSIDTPVKVAPYGITSTLSLADDILIEKMRAFYCKKFNREYIPITESVDDHRALRITAYLNLIHEIVGLRFSELKKKLSKDKTALTDYLSQFPALPENKTLPEQFVQSFTSEEEITAWLENNLHSGSIDVNIMTKLDKPNYKGNQKLPSSDNDAHAALRGFANSDLQASIVFSAGFNIGLFAYIESFSVFFPDTDGHFKKRIVVKVSDYRSALVHGKFFAKKGLWISEYRIESGLNGGGHQFPTQGHLMGPILEEFQMKRHELLDITRTLYKEAKQQKGIEVNENKLHFLLSAEGGVATGDEHRFLLDKYLLDSVGWGTPFLMVPEATNVDAYTLDLLKAAKKDDVVLSNISPLNVLFHSLKGNSKDIEKEQNIARGTPGSACPKKYLALNTEFTQKEVCTASRVYQKKKIEELQEKALSETETAMEYAKIVDKSCICVGLGTSALLVNDLDNSAEGDGVSMCPGPNIAYFDSTYSLSEMLNHIYNKKPIVTNQKTPHSFLRELELYIKYIKEKINSTPEPTTKQSAYFTGFLDNLTSGINYYKTLFSEYSFPDALKTLLHLESELALK